MSVNAFGIGAANSLQQVNNDSVAKIPGSRSSSVSSHLASGENTSFTSDLQTVQSLGQAALQTFPTRQEKVEALRQAVNGAQYQLDSAKIAVAIVSTDV